MAGAIAVILLCAGRASAWAASNGVPAVPAVPASATAAESSSNVEATQSATTAPSLAGSYADREASARNLENFKGGDVVIVGSGGVIIVLLLIIIILSL